MNGMDVLRMAGYAALRGNVQAGTVMHRMDVARTGRFTALPGNRDGEPA